LHLATNHAAGQIRPAHWENAKNPRKRGELPTRPLNLRPIRATLHDPQGFDQIPI